MSDSGKTIKELDQIIRKIMTVQRGNYLEKGEAARGMQSEVRKIIEETLNRENS